MTPKVLHVFPDSVVEPGQEHLGSTKDIRGRTQYFAERGMTVDECAHERSAGGMRRAVAAVDARPYDLIVVEFPLSGMAISQLRKRWPAALLLTRSANAELLHRRDWIRAMGPSVASTKLAVRTALNIVAEVWAARRSDAVVSISQWESEHYWPKLTSRAKTRWLPYYVPDEHLAELRVRDDEEEKGKVCVCLTSTKRNPLIEDSVRGFERAVGSLHDDDGWRFLVTGDLSAPTGPRIESTGLLASPAPLLRDSRAVALLSDYGYGFKTKLLDAVVAGNRVIVTPGLYRRIPEMLHPWTIEVRLDDPDSFATALRTAELPLPPGEPNEALRRLHHGVLDDLLDQHLTGRGNDDCGGKAGRG